MDELDGDPALSVAVLTGAGANFCAGMDLRAFLAGEDMAVPGRGLGFTERPPRKPIIAAVEGFALAGGSEFALATDLIVASREARFGLPEVRRGLVAGGGGLIRLPERIPYLKAMELALTGDNFTAEEGLSYGLVNRVTGPGGSLEGALELAERIARNGPLAVAATKAIVAAARDWRADEAFAHQIRNPPDRCSRHRTRARVRLAFRREAPSRVAGQVGNSTDEMEPDVSSLTESSNVVSLVTGGAGGLGEGVVRRLHKEGSAVVIADLADERAESLGGETGRPGHLRPDGRDQRGTASTLPSTPAYALGTLRHVVISHGGWGVTEKVVEPRRQPGQPRRVHQDAGSVPVRDLQRPAP